MRFEPQRGQSATNSATGVSRKSPRQGGLALTLVINAEKLRDLRHREGCWQAGDAAGDGHAEPAGGRVAGRRLLVGMGLVKQLNWVVVGPVLGKVRGDLTYAERDERDADNGTRFPLIHEQQFYGASRHDSQ